MLSTYKVYHSSSPMAFAYKYTISVSTLPVVDLEGSMESLSWKAAFETTMRKRTMHTTPTLELCFTVAVMHACQLNKFCSLHSPKQSHAFNSAGFKHNN